MSDEDDAIAGSWQISLRLRPYGVDSMIIDSLMMTYFVTVAHRYPFNGKLNMKIRRSEKKNNGDGHGRMA